MEATEGTEEVHEKRIGPSQGLCLWEDVFVDS
jgi:hypothetical protein